MASTPQPRCGEAPRALVLGFITVALLAASCLPLQRAEALDSRTSTPSPQLLAAPAILGATTTAATDALAAAQALAEKRQAALVAAAARADKVLPYDPVLIAAIGNQSDGGHTICCPAYACAYGDAVLTGQASGHAAYGCGCCTWPGWGGGNSSFRSLGSDQALLREAYDEIAAGRPTVVHVAGPYGEHWICLIGYRDVQGPDALTLDNFIALDPANGQEVVASYRYVPYGDACEHVSDIR